MYFGRTSPGYRFAPTGEFQLRTMAGQWVRADSTASDYERVYAAAYRALGSLPGPVRLTDDQRDERARGIARRNYDAVRVKRGCAKAA